MHLKQAISLGAAGAIVATGLGVASAADAASSPGWRIVQTPKIATSGSEIWDIDSVSPHNAWATGVSKQDEEGYGAGLLEHWNGSTWSRIGGTPAGHAYGNAVQTKANSLWMTSYKYDVGASYPYHYDGVAKKWSGAVTSGLIKEITGKLGTDGTHLWMVGWNEKHGQIARFSGGKWVNMTPSSIWTHAYLTAVKARTSSDVWVVGHSRSLGWPVLVHWNGKTWTVTKAPKTQGMVLTDVFAASATNAYAVGHIQGNSGVVGCLLHWNGKQWSRMSMPSLGEPDAIDGTATGKLWVAGNVTASGHKTSLLYYSGKTWARVNALPVNTDGYPRIDALAHIRGTSATWAAGAYSYDTDNAPDQLTGFIARDH